MDSKTSKKQYEPKVKNTPNNEDLERKAFTGLAVAVGTQCPTADEIAHIPDDMKVNFR